MRRKNAKDITQHPHIRERTKVAEHIAVPLPEKPDGGAWRADQLERARLTAQGLSPEQIAAKIGCSPATIYRNKKTKWWNVIVDYYIRLIDAKSTGNVALPPELRDAREEWREKDTKLNQLAIEVAFVALIETAQGMRVRDELKYKQLLAEGIDRDTADKQAREKGALPSPSARVWAAKELLESTGYTQAKRLMAKNALELERAAQQQESSDEGMAIDVTIEGVDDV